MPSLVAPLTDMQVNNAKPKEKQQKLADGGGLYLEVMQTGSKLWHNGALLLFSRRNIIH